jgi:hypothetical protein
MLRFMACRGWYVTDAGDLVYNPAKAKGPRKTATTSAEKSEKHDVAPSHFTMRARSREQK